MNNKRKMKKKKEMAAICLIPATQEAEIRRITVLGQPEQKLVRSCLKNASRV
jgi:hypothetical protein